MTIYRTDIKKALEDMILHREGFRFQSLAVILSKQKWPNLIASEWNKDLGLDAYTPARLTKNGLGIGLAASITGTLKQIKDEIDGKDGFKKHIDDVSILIFATPCPVTNYMKKKWEDEIQKDYEIELIILSKEDIVTDLLKPANISLCQSHLHIQVAVEHSRGNKRDISGVARTYAIGRETQDSFAIR